MTLKVFAGISLRSDEAVHFGTLVRIRTGLAGVQTDATYELGEMLEFQLELTGFDTTVHGLAQVRRADLHRDDLSNYLLRILKMRRSDQELLQEWYDQQQAGLEPSLTGEDHRALDSQVESRLPSAVGVNMPPPPSPTATKGRAAIRDLLLAAANGPQGSGTTGGAAALERELELRLDSDPPCVVLAYRSQALWQQDRDGQLSRGMLFLPLDPSALQLEAQLELVLQRPQQPELRCPARVALLHDRGVGLSIDLDPSQLS
jgi:hypothetical protein